MTSTVQSRELACIPHPADFQDVDGQHERGAEGIQNNGLNIRIMFFQHLCVNFGGLDWRTQLCGNSDADNVLPFFSRCFKGRIEILRRRRRSLWNNIWMVYHLLVKVCSCKSQEPSLTTQKFVFIKKTPVLLLFYHDTKERVEENCIDFIFIVI